MGNLESFKKEKLNEKFLDTQNLKSFKKEIGNRKKINEKLNVKFDDVQNLKSLDSQHQGELEEKDRTIANLELEYSKLATMGGEFVILYGWTNPTSIPGFNSLPVPSPEPDNNVPGKEKIVIPLNGQGTGGYWQAAKMNILSYDF